MGLYEIYDYIWNQRADPRTDAMPLIASPIIIPGILFSYLYFVFKCGPEFMKNRKPYNLKTYVKYYNVFQIIVNAYMVIRILQLGLLTEISVICHVPMFTNDYPSYQFAEVFWFCAMIKLIDLTETVVFVLRKKQTQITTLHVYHHVSIVLLSWLTTKFHPAEMASFSLAVNSFVHVIMYSYYYLSALGENAPKFLQKVKPLITIMQMAQFILLIAQNTCAYAPSCPVTKILPTVSIINLIINFVLFYDFYQKSYKKSQQKSR